MIQIIPLVPVEDFCDELCFTLAVPIEQPLDPKLPVTVFASLAVGN